MPKPEDTKQSGAPAEQPKPEVTHFWSAQCTGCHKVGNMQGKIDPKKGVVCTDCLAKQAEPASAPKE